MVTARLSLAVQNRWRKIRELRRSGISVREIAGMTGLSAATVYATIAAAKRAGLSTEGMNDRQRTTG